MDPHAANDYRSALASRGAYEQLIALKADKTDAYEGLIAETWEANEDNSVWTFHLRPGVTFHDGSPCDAEAVRASFERMFAVGMGPATELGRFITDPAQVTGSDPTTVVFNLGRPQPLFEAGLSSQYGGQIVNAKLAKTHDNDGDWGRAWAQLNEEGLGTGPYRIVEFEPGEQLILERYEAHWRGWDGDHFDRIVVRVVPENETRRQLIEQGEVDITEDLTPEVLQALEQNPSLIVDRSYSTQVNDCILTVAGPLKSPAARQAMCYAFPYDEVISGVYKGYGKPAVGPVAELCRGFAPGTPTYTTDLTKAKALFANAGVAEGTEITLTYPAGDAKLEATVQLFKKNLADIGMTLTAEAVDFATFTSFLFTDRNPEEQPLVMPFYWWPAYNDAWDHLQLQVLCSSQGAKGGNAGYYCNKRVDELMGQARDAADPQVYQRAMAEVERILSLDDPSAIYYMQPQWPTILRKDIVGFVFNPIYLGTYDLYGLHRAAT